MLSRTADNLYWVSRYVERAESLARILEATHRLTATPISVGAPTTNEWDSAVATAGCSQAFYTAYDEAREDTVTEFLAFSPDNPSSIRNCIEIARANGRAVRTALTVEMWDTLNTAWHELHRFGRCTSREEVMRFLRWVQSTSLRFDGSAYRTMLRNDCYAFSRLGVFIERADNTARILDVKYHVLLPENEQVGGPLDYFQWAAILRSVSALTSYHWVYRDSLKPWRIADLLILNQQMPRSLASCYGNLVRNLDDIAQLYALQGPSQRKARAMLVRMKNLNIEQIFQSGLHEFILEFLKDNANLGDSISKQYLS